VTLAASLGCSGNSKPKSKSKDATSSTKKDVEDQTQVINSQGGTAYGWTQDEPKKHSWSVTWETVQFTFKPRGETISDMKGTHGSFFQDGVEASRFQSAAAHANQKKGDIDVDKNVVVISLTQKVTLRCDHIHYASKDTPPLVKATGNVEVDGPWGAVTGLKEVWATPDLKTFGTPDLFPSK
jgi:hypothetical protein